MFETPKKEEKMRIDSDTVFHFGKYKGKSFKWVLVNNIGYLKFLLSQGFNFNRDCIWLLEESFKIESEIIYKVTKKTNVLNFIKKEFVILQPKKFVRKKDKKIILSEEIVKVVDISNVPFHIEKKEVTSSHFDSRGLQMDDRFFTTTEIRESKIYNTDILNSIIDLNIKEL